MTKAEAKASMPKEEWQALKGRAQNDSSQRLYRRWQKRYGECYMPISLRWLECVDDELSALAVKLSLSMSKFGK